MASKIPVVHSPETFRPLHEANALLGDNAALWAQYERDGYLFFRNVLDLEAVGRLQEAYAHVLGKQGLLAEGDKDFRFSGIDLSTMRAAGGALLTADELHVMDVWREFVAHPKIDGFIRNLIGEEPYWLPMNEHKAIPPARRGETRFNFVHQDSFYNTGITFLTFWVPVADIDADTGGIAVAEGLHHVHYHNADNPPAFFIEEGAIPQDAWARADYHPGDVLIMHPKMPHSGLSNHSDRFRVSMNVRFVPKSKRTAIAGKAVSVTSDKIAVQEADGTVSEFVIDDDTDFRNYGVGLFTRSEVGGLYKPGDDIIVGNADGRATLIRRTSAAAYMKEVGLI